MTMTRRRLLDDTFKKSVVGNPAIATDSLARMYPGIEMQGWTKQDGTSTPEAPVPIVSAGTQNQDTGKWEYEVEVGRGNLFNIHAEPNMKGIQISEFNGDKFIWNAEHEYDTNRYVLGVSPNKDYALSFKECSENAFLQVSTILQDETNKINIILNRDNKNASFNSQEYSELTVSIFASDVGVQNFIDRAMLNPGSTALPYTPYRTPQTVTLTADRPLTKWDRLEKRNGQWGWVYKSAEIESYTDESVPGEYYSTTGQLSVGAQVWYETATETFVPLSPEEQEAMNALHTFRPTTVLSNDCDCNMILTYKTKKSLEVTT